MGLLFGKVFSVRFYTKHAVLKEFVQRWNQIYAVRLLISCQQKRRDFRPRCSSI